MEGRYRQERSHVLRNSCSSKRTSGQTQSTFEERRQPIERAVVLVENELRNVLGGDEARILGHVKLEVLDVAEVDGQN